MRALLLGAKGVFQGGKLIVLVEQGYASPGISPPIRFNVDTDLERRPIRVADGLANLVVAELHHAVGFVSRSEVAFGKDSSPEGLNYSSHFAGVKAALGLCNCVDDFRGQFIGVSQ